MIVIAFASTEIFLHCNWQLDLFNFFYLHPSLGRGSVGGTPALAGTGASVFGELSSAWPKDVGTVADGSALEVGSPVKKVHERL